MSEIVLAGAVRTPIGSFNGGLGTVPAHVLGQTVIDAVLKRANVDAKDVFEVIMGQILTAGEGQSPARHAAIGAGVPNEATPYTIKVCGSGLHSVALGYLAIRSGARVLVTRLHEMVKRDARGGLATLRIGGGTDIAMCVARN